MSQIIGSTVAVPSWIRVGRIEIGMISDGTLQAELKTILHLEPSEARGLIDAEATRTGHDPLLLPVRAFLIRTAGRLVLADTGSGRTKGPSMGHLPDSLAKLGVAGSDVDAIVMTHLHMDHAGGLVDEGMQRAFPRAELIVHAEEGRYFIDTPDEALDARSRRHVAFQRAAVAAYGADVRRVADGGGLPGIAACLTPGHTPGHTAWKIETGERPVLVIGDVVHMSAIQLPRPLTPMIYDVDPELAGRTRVKLLDDAAATGAIVAGAHLQGIGIGTITKAGDGYAFSPL